MGINNVKLVYDPPVDAAKPPEDTYLMMMFGWLFGKDNIRDYETKLLIIAGIEMLFFSVCVVDAVLDGQLTNFGIHPRTGLGLLGIFVAPFVHISIAYFILNCLPFFVLSSFVMMRPLGISRYLALSAFEIVVGGFLVWCFGRTSIVHIGSDGLVFAYFGYLLVFGVVSNDVRAAAIALLVCLLFGGVFWGVLPSTQAEVSWETHLVGCVLGFVAGASDAKFGAMFFPPASDYSAVPHTDFMDIEEPDPPLPVAHPPGTVGAAEADDTLDDGDLV